VLIPKRILGTRLPASVTITRSGTICLSRSAVEFLKHHVRNAAHVLLYWDNEVFTMGIQPIKRASKQSYRLQYDRQGKSASLSGVGFLSRIDYKPDRGVPFNASWNEAEGLLDIDFKKRLNRARTKYIPHVPKPQFGTKRKKANE
jgi:hypothetical protein